MSDLSETAEKPKKNENENIQETPIDEGRENLFGEFMRKIELDKIKVPEEIRTRMRQLFLDETIKPDYSPQEALLKYIEVTVKGKCLTVFSVFRFLFNLCFRQPTFRAWKR